MTRREKKLGTSRHILGGCELGVSKGSRAGHPLRKPLISVTSRRGRGLFQSGRGFSQWPGVGVEAPHPWAVRRRSGIGFPFFAGSTNKPFSRSLAIGQRGGGRSGLAVSRADREVSPGAPLRALLSARRDNPALHPFPSRWIASRIWGSHWPALPHTPGRAEDVYLKGDGGRSAQSIPRERSRRKSPVSLSTTSRFGCKTKRS